MREHPSARDKRRIYNLVGNKEYFSRALCEAFKAKPQDFAEIRIASSSLKKIDEEIIKWIEMFPKYKLKIGR